MLTEENSPERNEINQEEALKEIYVCMCGELGCRWIEVSKERQVDIYLPRVDVLSLIPKANINIFKDTVFEHIKPLVCFEFHL